jgi:hypothetical protein
VNTNRRVGGTRASRDKANARSSSEFALGFGHESRTTFLPARYKADGLAVHMEAVQNGQKAFSGYTESMGDALGQEAFNKQVARYFCLHDCIVHKLPGLAVASVSCVLRWYRSAQIDHNSSNGLPGT